MYVSIARAQNTKHLTLKQKTPRDVADQFLKLPPRKAAAGKSILQAEPQFPQSFPRKTDLMRASINMKAYKVNLNLSMPISISNLNSQSQFSILNSHLRTQN